MNLKKREEDLREGREGRNDVIILISKQNLKAPC